MTGEKWGFIDVININQNMPRQQPETPPTSSPLLGSCIFKNIEIASPEPQGAASFYWSQGRNAMCPRSTLMFSRFRYEKINLKTVSKFVVYIYTVRAN
jgi:hypothetical protein